MLTGFTRLRLVSDDRRPTRLVLRRGDSGAGSQTFSLGRQFSLTGLESDRLHPGSAR